jgi:DNA-binding MarR family transcriptional regulator
MNDKLNSFLNAQQTYWPEAYEGQLLLLRIALFHAQLAQHSRASEVIIANGLSVVEFDVLATLRRSPQPYALTPSDIQHSMLITSGGLTKILIELENRGLISRTTDESDRRIKPVALTEKGMPLLHKTMYELNTVLKDWVNSSLSSAEVNQLANLLVKLCK